jgi:hypothetical protein
MTNDVVQTFTATFCWRLAPLRRWSLKRKKLNSFATFADALLINVGTLTAPRAQSMRRAIERRCRRQTLDAGSGCGRRADVPHPFLPSNPRAQTCCYSR